MALADLRVALMSFPQSWDGATLSLNLLCVPSVDPLATPLVGAAPAFADRVPQFRAVTIVVPAAPVAPRPQFLNLAAQATSLGVVIGPPPAPPATAVARIRKALPASYLTITGRSPTGDLTTTTDD